MLSMTIITTVMFLAVTATIITMTTKYFTIVIKIIYTFLYPCCLIATKLPANLTKINIKS